MSPNEKEVETILKNWKLFRKICNKLGDRAANVQTMLDYFDERAPFAPASSRLEYHGAYPGGLIEHSLRVLKYARTLDRALEYDLPIESLIISTLFHDWGKAGDLERDRYVPQQSDWHRERGMMYNLQKEGQWMMTDDCTLWLFNHFGITLSQDEYLAILLNDGPYHAKNQPYGMKEPKLALVVHAADRFACEEEIGKTSVC
jgi:hypothetical protein